MTPADATLLARLQVELLPNDFRGLPSPVRQSVPDAGLALIAEARARLNRRSEATDAT